MKYVECLCRACAGCCGFFLNCEAWSCRCSCMEGMGVRHADVVSLFYCVHHVAVLDAEFCITCSLLMLV